MNVIRLIQQNESKWRRVILQDLVKCTGGTSFPPTMQGKKTGPIPFYKVSDMNESGNHLLMNRANNYIDQEDLSLLRTAIHSPGSVIFPKVGGALLTNKKRILTKPSLVDNNIMVVSVLNDSICIPEFIYLFFETIDLRNLSNPGPLPSINAARVYEQDLLLPPFAEQKKITTILFRIQKAIEIQESIIEKARELKKSTLHHVFTRGLHGEKLKETEIGPIPESWRINRINSHVSDTALIDPSKTPYRRIKYIDVSSVSNSRYVVETCAHLLGKDAPSRARKVVKENDVIVATVRPTLRRLVLVTQDFNNEICSTAFCVLRARKDILEHKYLFYVIQRDEFFEGLEKIQQGASYPAVTDADIKDQWIPLPDMGEQKEIAYCFQIIDQKIEMHIAKRVALQDLFKTMLNKLMTDEIRVKDLDIDVSEISA